MTSQDGSHEWGTDDRRRPRCSQRSAGHIGHRDINHVRVERQVSRGKASPSESLRLGLRPRQDRSPFGSAPNLDINRDFCAPPVQSRQISRSPPATGAPKHRTNPRDPRGPRRPRATAPAPRVSKSGYWDTLAVDYAAVAGVAEGFICSPPVRQIRRATAASSNLFKGVPTDGCLARPNPLES